MAPTNREEHSGSGMNTRLADKLVANVCTDSPPHMNPRLADKLLDRIAEISEGNVERTTRYLTGKANGAERQAKFKQARLNAGERQIYVWLSEPQMVSLKKSFPGPRGGIDWDKVIEAALKGRPAESLGGRTCGKVDAR
jgi:hypothetical protein